MSEVKTTPAKYVFLDVVGFTKRNVDAQADIVASLNSLVSNCLNQLMVPEEKRILIPTGDGICIALLNIKDPLDIHMLIALGILRALDEHNEDPTLKESRKFQVRIGVSANDDNLVTDINGSLNIAGAGINTAQRVMDKADGNQILVSQMVFETLHRREGYMGSFRSYRTTDKHGEEVQLHQFVNEGVPELNLDVPRTFKQPRKEGPKEPELTEHVAYYLAHAIKNAPTLLERMGDSFARENAGITLLYFLATDSEARRHAAEFETASLQTYKADSATFEEQLKYYAGLDENLVWHFSRHIRWSYKDYLDRYGKCFREDSFGMTVYRAISEYGKRKLKEEWPQIWDEFGLDEYVSD